MTTHTETSVTPAGTNPRSADTPPAAGTPDDIAGESPATGTPAFVTLAGRPMILVSELAAHPGNVREDLNLTPEFLASVAVEGVRIPLLVTPAGAGGGWRVIEGHRRLAAAVATGLAEVPCDIDPDRAGDEAGQYLDMLLANSGSYRANYGAGEEAAALFAAYQAGAPKTRLRRATGRTAAEVRSALAAGGLPTGTRARAAEVNEQVTLDELAILAEFDGDPAATERLLTCLEQQLPLEHVAERIRQDRAEAAGHQKVRAGLEAAGVTVTDSLPDAAAWLTGLTHDGEDLTPDSHAACPGHGATFRSWDLLNPSWYCASPAGHGHLSRSAVRAPAGSSPNGDGAAGSGGSPQDGPGPDRRLVVTGNKAWLAAAQVRHRWLAASLFARRSLPREGHVFLAGQLLAMPEPLRANLAAARRDPLLVKVTGHDAGQLDGECDTATTGRLAVLMLAPVITAYEHALTEGDGRNTWRADRYSPCPRACAAAYFTFLAAAGYPLSDIERTVADGTAYTGDGPRTATLAAGEEAAAADTA